jgi:hypothetical protein
MSTSIIEAQPQVAQLMDFADPAPEEREADNPDDIRWGWSPGLDLDCADRKVGWWPQGDGKLRAYIPRCALVPFRTITVLDENPQRRDTPEAMYTGAIGQMRQLAWQKKSAKNCAEELRIAYQQDTPVGFQVFDAPWVAEKKDKKGHVLETVRGRGFVGRERDEAFELYKLVLPYVLTPPDILLYLTTQSEEEVKGAGLPPEVEAATLAVMRQMVDGTRQFVAYGEGVLDLSRREIGERPGTGKGKPVFDRLDKRLAELLGQSLDAPKAVVQQLPAVQDPALAEALKMIAEKLPAQAIPAESPEIRAMREQVARLEQMVADLASGKGTR